MDDWLPFSLAVLVIFFLGVVVGVSFGGPDLAMRQRACWGDLSRFNGDTLKVIREHSECLELIYPEQPK